MKKRERFGLGFFSKISKIDPGNEKLLSSV